MPDGKKHAIAWEKPLQRMVGRAFFKLLAAENDASSEWKLRPTAVPLAVIQSGDSCDAEGPSVGLWQ